MTAWGRVIYSRVFTFGTSSMWVSDEDARRPDNSLWKRFVEWVIKPLDWCDSLVWSGRMITFERVCMPKKEAQHG